MPFLHAAVAVHSQDGLQVLDGVSFVGPDLGSASETGHKPHGVPFQSSMQLSQYTASVRPKYLMLLSVMLAQTVIPHSVQQMSMMFSCVGRILFPAGYDPRHIVREATESKNQRK